METARGKFAEHIMKCFYLDGETLEEKIVSAGKLFGPDYEKNLRIALSEDEAGQLGLDSSPDSQKIVL